MSARPLPRRLSPEASREAALAAARALLVEAGPQGLTLKAVANRIGRTHATLLHHFGSAEGLQRALVEWMAAAITGTIRDQVLRARALGMSAGTNGGDAAAHGAREVVDLVFDAFGDGGGAGALASWMILSGNEDALDPILTAIQDLVEELSEGQDAAARPIREETLRLVLVALGDALLGAPMARALGLPRGKARELAWEGLGRRG